MACRATLISSPSACFTRDQRLLKPAEFTSVFAKGTKVGGAFFNVFALPNDQPLGRLGLAIAKRNVRRSVDRSRIKRLIRENFRHQQQCLQGLDIVVLAKRNVLDVDNKTLNQQLARQWKKVLQRCSV